VHARVLCEIEVSNVENGSEELTELGNQAVAETNRAERILELVETLAVAGSGAADTRLEVPVVGEILEMEVVPFLAVDARDKVVEDVEVALAACRSLRNTRTLKVIVDRLETLETATVCELELRVRPVPRSVVVGNCVRVAKRFEDELAG